MKESYYNVNYRRSGISLDKESLEDGLGEEVLDMEFKRTNT